MWDARNVTLSPSLTRLSAMLRPEAPVSKEGLRDQIVATMRAVSSC